MNGESGAWVMRFEATGPVRVAVKDVIDVAGVPTSAGCVAVRASAAPAAHDAACLAGVRASTAAIVGKTQLTELCLDPVGVNEAFGTPVNPIAPDVIPGGSSSGSAVAVAGGEADLGLGTDTGGSVRIPAACCGIVGLNTTWGRISTAGVWPLARSLDSVGPLARDVAGVAGGMRLLEPGFEVAAAPASVIGRLRIDGVDARAEEAVDAALSAAGLTVHSVTLAGWDGFWQPFDTIVQAELWQAHGRLAEADGVGDRARRALRGGAAIGADRLASAYAAQRAWRAEVAAVFDRVRLLALPTLRAQPPRLGHTAGFRITMLTAPFNLAGVPALSLPLPAPGWPVPYALQLVGPHGSEELLCATGLAVEAAVARRA